jgi:hypothetical protein
MFAFRGYEMDGWHLNLELWTTRNRIVDGCDGIVD